MSDSIRFDDRMSESDALIWHVEQDPILRSTITVVWLLDRPPDRPRLEEKLERATRLIPRLRQRVAANPLSIAPPRWEVDPYFDRAYHCRFLTVRGDRTLRAVLDMAQIIAEQGFDRARPLWEFYLIDGLADGGAAMVIKLHHSISDGVGLVQMTSSLVERYREPDPARVPKPMPPEPEARELGRGERMWNAFAHERDRQLAQASRFVGALGRGIGQTLRDPLGAARQVPETIGSLGRLLAPVSEPMSPILRGRSLKVRFDTLPLSLPAARAAGKRVGGTVNDAFVSGVAGGLRYYHEIHRAPVSQLRMTMPINVRSEDSARAGNQFVPARFLVPIDIVDPLERTRAIHELVGRQRGEPALALVDDVSRTLSRLPRAVFTGLFGSMLKGVDFVTSNVPGPPFDVFVSGGRVEAVYGFGPLTGAAANLTLFSYRDQLGLAVATDQAAVRDPEVFVDCLRRGCAEVMAPAEG